MWPYSSIIKRSIALAAVVSCSVLVAAGAAARDARDVCTQGVRPGTTLFRFCGPARATVRIDARTYRMSSGKCQLFNGGTTFGVDIGAVGPATEEPTHSYFGAEVRPPKPGVHVGQLVAIAVPGTRVDVPRATVTLKPSLRGGTFSGRVRGGGMASGSFTCGG